MRAAVTYDDLARAFLLGAKVSGRRELLRDLGDLLAADLRAAGFSDGNPVLVAVPSHPWTCIARGFSPAAELVRRIGPALRLRAESRLLVRRWLPVGSAKRLSRRERAQLLRLAVRVAPFRRVPRDVLLVDDVMTTGTTLGACAAALAAGGARRIRAAVWARAL